MSLMTTVQGFTPYQWAIVAVALFITYFFTAAIYNLFFNPLAKYPGPFLAKISVWPSYYHTLNGNRHIWVWQCHQIYGSTFRYRPDGLMFNSPTGYHSIYSAKANVVKGHFYRIWSRKANNMDTWTSIDKAQHESKRRVLAHAFSENAIRSAETFVIRHVNRWCELLGENTQTEWSEPRDMARWAAYLVFDILGDLCFGKSMDIKEPGENQLKDIPSNIVYHMKLLYCVANAPFSTVWLWLKPRGLDSLLHVLLPKDVKTYHQWVETSVAERTKVEAEIHVQGSEPKNVRNDMFHYLFQAKDPETGLSAYPSEELFQEASLLTIAGSDTVTTALAGTIFYLTRNPRVYARLTQEIRTTFQTVDEIHSGTKLRDCHYLRACLDEAMRMSSPVPSDLTREVLPGGMEVDGIFVPQGTQIATGNYSLHHNESVFLDPFVYRPERWIVDEKSGVSSADVARAESAFFPFSTGARGCVGKNLAYLELTVTVARLLFLLDVKVTEGNTVGEGTPDLIWGRRNENQFQVKDFFIACKEGPMAQFKIRQTETLG